MRQVQILQGMEIVPTIPALLNMFGNRSGDRYADNRIGQTGKKGFDRMTCDRFANVRKMKFQQGCNGGIPTVYLIVVRVLCVRKQRVQPMNLRPAIRAVVDVAHRAFGNARPGFLMQEIIEIQPGAHTIGVGILRDHPTRPLFLFGIIRRIFFVATER